MYKKIREKAGIVCKCCGVKMNIIRAMIPTKKEARRLALMDIITRKQYVM